MVNTYTVNCTWSDWGNWSSCSISCGEALAGRKVMERTKIVEEKFGGQCDDNDTIVHSCPSVNITCPRGCEWGEWNNNGTWSECSVTCAKGTKKRTRDIKLKPEPGGRECSSMDSLETSECTLNPCPGKYFRQLSKS